MSVIMEHNVKDSNTKQIIMFEYFPEPELFSDFSDSVSFQDTDMQVKEKKLKFVIPLSVVFSPVIGKIKLHG